MKKPFDSFEEPEEGNTGVEKYSILDEIEMTISISEDGHLSNNLWLLFSRIQSELNDELRTKKAQWIGVMEDNADLRQSLSELIIVTEKWAHFYGMPEKFPEDKSAIERAKKLNHGNETVEG